MSSRFVRWTECCPDLCVVSARAEIRSRTREIPATDSEQVRPEEAWEAFKRLSRGHYAIVATLEHVAELGAFGVRRKSCLWISATFDNRHALQGLIFSLFFTQGMRHPLNAAMITSTSLRIPWYRSAEPYAFLFSEKMQVCENKLSIESCEVFETITDE